MLADLNHPVANGEEVYDTTFENVQAGQRTSLLFRLANENGALVLGTGDLSELALGWCTYGVGDQMSHYNVNGSVPKTLIRHLIRWMIDTELHDAKTAAVLTEVVEDVISPNSCLPARTAPSEHRGRRRPVRAARFLPLLRHPLRLPPEQGRLPGAPDVVGLLRRPDDRQVADRVPQTVHGQPVQAHRDAQRAEKSGRAARSRARGDWRSPSDATARPWLDDLR